MNTTTSRLALITAGVFLGIALAYLAYTLAARANAEPAGCTASNLSSTLGGVASATGGWLSSHPEAEAAVNTADENQIRSYFAAHQPEWSQLQSIASPLRSLRQSCPQQVSPADVARLYDAMAS